MTDDTSLAGGRGKSLGERHTLQPMKPSSSFDNLPPGHGPLQCHTKPVPPGRGQHRSLFMASAVGQHISSKQHENVAENQEEQQSMDSMPTLVFDSPEKSTKRLKKE